MQKNNQHTLYPWASIGFIVLILFTSCQSTKKKDEISGIKKFYHNTTAYYNGYFNANELINEVVLKMKNSYKDNYTQVLPVYKYMANLNADAFRPQLDTAIKKVSRVVALHVPSRWVDDCYLIAGKSQYLKYNFEDAEKTLRYATTAFDPSDPNSRYWEYEKKPGAKDKKKKSKKEYTSVYTTEASGANAGLFGEKPAYQESLFWLGRTLIERDKGLQAESILRHLHSTSEGYLKTESAIALAHYYIKNKEYKKAIPHLEYGTIHADNKDERARYAYITGQINEKIGDFKKASFAYDRAESLANDYEMIFNSKLNRVESAFKNNIISKEEALKKLESMSEDGKNKEYLDQVYFAKATVYLHEDEEDLALENFRLSLSNSSGKEFIIAESYYELSQLFFGKDAFVEAKLYLDSTLNFLSKSDDRYSEIKNRSEILNPIYDKLLEIKYKDSLLYLAGLSEEELEKVAKEILRKEQLEKELAASRTQSNNLPKNRKLLQSISPSISGVGQSPTVSGISSSSRQLGNNNELRRENSSFFAYKDSEKTKKAFQREWGERPLVDNWRVSALIEGRISSNQENGKIEGTELNNQVVVTVSGSDIERIFKDVPKSESDIKSIESEIAIAMLDLGFLYRQTLNRPDLTIKILEELNKRFPKSQKELESFYNLYLAYKEVNRIEKSKYYKKKIIDYYPNSKFAKILKDPSYVEQLMSEDKELEEFYEGTVTAFYQNNYDKAKQNIDMAKDIFAANNKFSTKFALLNAMIAGKTSGEEKYADELRKVINKYPNSNEAVRAKEILRFLNGDNSAFSNEANTTNFALDDEKMHYIIIQIHNASKVDMNKVKYSISDFNKEYFQLMKLNITTQYLDIKDTGSPIIIIRRFDNKTKAMQYYETSIQFKERFQNDSVQYSTYAITQSNYREVLKQRSLVDYRSFFEQHYLRN